MNKKIKAPEYTDEPIQLGERVTDFLPSPAELAMADETIKVTITLSRRSVDFFKKASQDEHVPYQKMIRRLLDDYVQIYQRSKQA